MWFVNHLITELNLISPANYTADNNSTACIPVVSIATSTIIGITIAISFVVFFSLGVLVATCIGCMVKKRSKSTPAQQPVGNDMIGTSQGRISEIIVETNSAYDVAECKGNNQLPDYYI